MATTLSIPQEGTLTVTYSNRFMLKNIKRLSVWSRGGGIKVSIPRNKQLSGYDQARLDVKEGRILSYDSLDDLGATR